ncbi:MAG: hypothetical protein IJT91_02725, partial [Clostridia bacterium]|nr:hypothetical protein [Clostridia bacterium]
EMMKKIRSISDSMGLGSDIPEAEENGENKADTEDRPVLPEKRNENRKAANRTALIKAIMPYLSENRREKADMLLKLIGLADLRKFI